VPHLLVTLTEFVAIVRVATAAATEGCLSQKLIRLTPTQVRIEYLIYNIHLG